MNDREPSGVIAQVRYKGGSPRLYKFVDRRIPEERKVEFPWLTVITWAYDGSANEGMPEDGDLTKMKLFESTLRGTLEADAVCTHAISKIGDNFKELLYYATDPDEFLAALNRALSGLDRFPIEIDFSEDPSWGEFEAVLRMHHATKPNQQRMI